MPKRKRFQSEDSTPDNEESASRAIAVQQKQVEARIVHGKKLLTRALKFARGFERQKLGRRQKTAKGKDEELARLDTEIAALKVTRSKGLDISEVAENHIHKTLHKSKAISTAPGFARHAEPNPRQNGTPQDHARVNIIARLYNSNPVKEVMEEIFRGVREVLDIESGGTLHNKPSKHAASKEDRSTDKKFPERAQAALESETSAENNEKSTVDQAWEGLDARDEVRAAIIRTTSAGIDEAFHTYPRERDESNSSDEISDLSNDAEDLQDEEQGEDGDFSKYDARLGNSSSSETEDLELLATNKKNSQSPALLSLSHLAYRSLSPPPRKPPKSKQLPQDPRFLPSLTLGGYYSGSSGSSAASLSDTDIAPRKNRRGQRARQQLWEKKFGTKANHLRDEGKKGGQQKQGTRGDDWDARRGARSSGDGRGRGRGRGRVAGMGRGGNAFGDRGQGRGGGMGGRVQTSGANSEAVRETRGKGKDDEGKLHPSWEAAKKAKEQKKETKFLGKKVVFD
ncbi:MAG: hypothetical protein M1827_007603 [Pycnora praestabilis]|nr:MAG: hypothetical protein M1827_007603 [Pycnora praestabilis]